jgi:hypothetical protein
MVLMIAGAEAQEATQVVKLRTATVALFDKPNGAKVVDYPRDKFRDPWPIVGSSPEGLLQVQVDGDRYWVRPYAVETNRPVRANAECGAVVASNQPRAAATRGLGEECKK